MALTVAQVFTRVADILNDIGNVRWTSAELLRYLSDGRRVLLIQRPDLYATTEVIDLAGGTRQTIPSTGHRLLNVHCNVSADGSTRGRAMRPVDEEVLERVIPSWRSVANAEALVHWMYDERHPRVFEVYPQAVLGQKVEITYTAEPTELAGTGTELTQEGPYGAALVDYVVHRALSKDEEHAMHAERARLHYESFINLVSEGDQREVPASPNTARSDGQPARGG